MDFCTSLLSAEIRSQKKSKSQTTNHKQIPIIKIQNFKRRSLRFGIWDLFEIWCLEFEIVKIAEPNFT